MGRSIHRTAVAALAGLGLLGSVATCTGVPRAPSPFVAGTGAGDATDEAWSPDEVRREEILSRGRSDHTAMAVIRRLRPGWLRARGQKSLNDPGAAYPIVYVDEVRHGGLATLNHIPASEIFALQFFNTADATTRWGTGHPSGVINVVTGRF